jgi:hypothetical protein
LLWSDGAAAPLPEFMGRLTGLLELDLKECFV